MSSASVAEVSRGNLRSGQGDPNTNSRNSRNERSTGKGRRRRFAAEQRRIDQQRWVQYPEDDDFIVVPPPPSRRQLRRASRRNGREDLDFVEYPNDHDLDIAFALSLSLTGSRDENVPEVLDMSYESLVQLQDVRCVATNDCLKSLTQLTYDETLKAKGGQDAELCVICQLEYTTGENLIQLPCVHQFHCSCAMTWLSSYSKICPICKHDVTTEAK